MSEGYYHDESPVNMNLGMMSSEGPTSAILDQVDECLHARREQGRAQGSRPGSRNGDSDERHVSDDLDMDLDQLSRVLMSTEEKDRADSASFLDQDSLSPMAHASPGHFQLDFSLMDAEAEAGAADPESQGEDAAQRDAAEAQEEHVRPDMVFSPMVSPMVMPTNSLHNTPFMGPAYSGASGGGSSGQNTPCMHGHRSNSSVVMSQHQQSFSLPDASIGSSSSRKTSVNSTRSKRTPHTTPLMGPSPNTQASNSNKIIKNSPHIASRRSISKFKTNGWDDMVFKLPDSSLKNDTAASNINNNVSYTPSSTHSSSNGSVSDRMTPSSLMNYPKIILPSNSNNCTVSNDESILRATESPVIKPRKPSEQQHYNLASQRQSSVEKSSPTGHSKNSNGTSNCRNENDNSSTQKFSAVPGSQNNSHYGGSSMDLQKDTKPPNSGPNSTTSTAATSVSSAKSAGVKTRASVGGRVSRSRSLHKMRSSSEDEAAYDDDDDNDDTVKKQKQVHKVAEQGRRNRLNNALKDLDSLIPKELKDSATIPSKATTVELAAQYIRQLQRSDS